MFNGLYLYVEFHKCFIDIFMKLYKTNVHSIKNSNNGKPLGILQSLIKNWSMINAYAYMYIFMYIWIGKKDGFLIRRCPPTMNSSTNVRSLKKIPFKGEIIQIKFQVLNYTVYYRLSETGLTYSKFRLYPHNTLPPRFSETHGQYTCTIIITLFQCQGGIIAPV